MKTDCRFELPALLALLWVAGCASAPSCKTVAVMGAGPASGVADHATVAPGNQQQFQADVHYAVEGSGTGCAVPAIAALVHPAWTSTDPEHITISSADDATNGLATCTGATVGAATLTATLPAGSNALGTSATPLTATVQLTCK